MYMWGYQYVENLTWVYLDANNTILTTPSDYAQKSHLTLFIFRKEGDSVCAFFRVNSSTAHYAHQHTSSGFMFIAQTIKLYLSWLTYHLVLSHICHDVFR